MANTFSHTSKISGRVPGSGVNMYSAGIFVRVYFCVMRTNAQYTMPRYSTAHRLLAISPPHRFTTFSPPFISLSLFLVFHLSLLSFSHSQSTPSEFPALLPPSQYCQHFVYMYALQACGVIFHVQKEPIMSPHMVTYVLAYADSANTVRWQVSRSCN